MFVRKDIVALSVPFTLGVAAAAVSEGFSQGLYIVSSLCGIAAVALLCLAARNGRQQAAVYALFFALGAFCWINDHICGSPAARQPEAALRGLERLTAAIDAAGFRKPGTAALLKALLTGQRKALDQATVAAFRAAGASHILALSGLHLGIIYACIALLLRIFGNGRAAGVARAVISVTACGFYTVMTGAGPSIVRAFLFITMNEISRLLPHRRRDPLAVLCTALLIQLCISPSVISSVGFQLSYLAMLGIFLIYPPLETWYPEGFRFDPLRRIWCSIALTISCQVFTAPLVWMTFRSFPKYFLLTNLVALPLTEALMACSVASISLSALGWCPEMLKGLVDALAQALIFCLKTIASI